MLNLLGGVRPVVRTLVLLALAFAVVPVAQAQDPNVVINEIMQNPSAVADSVGEWFEIVNLSAGAIDMDGWTILDNDTDSHVINNGGPLLVGPGGYLVFGVNGDPTVNGGLTVDYVYSGIAIANGADELVLLDTQGTEIDRVEYDGGPDFPDPNGASMALIDPALDNNVGANWCEAQTPYGAGDLGTPGTANDCAGPLEQLIINEIMNNPAAVSDAAGEWLEIHNPTVDAVDIDGWVLEDNDSDSHTIANGGPLLVPAGGFIVLGNNADAATNGGAPVAYEYSDFFLANGFDEVVLIDDLAREIDRVEYDDGATFPDPNGASMALIDPALDNNAGENWCESPTPFGDGDLGTPGGANDCPLPPPDLVINEIMNNPAAVSDSAGEWFEIFNPTAADVDIDGWTIRDDGSDNHVITNGGPLVISAGGFLVLGNNIDPATNGGAPVDYSYGASWFLSNGADEVILVEPSGIEIDRVEYDGGPVFPDPNGASMALFDPTLDNNDGTNWCTSSTPFGAGDSGTPGAINDCSIPAVEVIINEIHADPASGSAGDANRDGVRDFSDDEFVEIVNLTGAPLDISGWTLSDAVQMRHSFPDGTVLANECGVVVFGGGTPTGDFGGMVVQTASTGALGLNNGGDTVTLSDGAGIDISVSYGGEGGDNQSLTRDPDLTGGFVKHSDATGSDSTLFSPGTRIDGYPFGGCGYEIPTLEIWEIQGSGLSSPVAGLVVSTAENPVTTVGTNGFFIQTPASRTDGDRDTSDGIFVFTGGAPTVAVGDLVDVTGRVVEFFGFTEFASSSIVTPIGMASTLPAPVLFDATVPSPDPTAPSCAIEFECYESMRVEVMAGAVTGPNQSFGSDPIAEVYITAAPDRTFREPGIEFPGLVGYPVWDGNPEVFELDPDKLGLANRIIPAGSSFSALGVLGFEFGGYELWPSELVVDERAIPIPVRQRAFDEFTVGSLNMFRFFDDIDDPPSTAADGRTRDDNDDIVSLAEYERRREKFVQHILEVLDAPDILAVQEVEKIEVLETLAADIAAVDPSVVYTSYLIEGNDVSTIDIGFMVRDSITVDGVLQLGKDETFINPENGEEEILHDRPPLLLQGRHLDQTLVQVFNVHMRSLSGIEGQRQQQKRYDQANSVAEKVQMVQDIDAEAPIIATGDFNAFQFSDSYVDLVGQILGDYLPEENLVCETNTCEDLVEPNLANQIETLPEEEKYSFIFRGNAQVLDHSLTSVGMEPFLRGFDYGRGNADAAEDWINDDSNALRSSDHDGLVLYVLADGDLDGVPDHLDVCPGTEIPEGVPTVRLGTNRWALVDDDFYFDTNAPGRGKLAGFSEMSRRPMEIFSTTDTAGCSCEQIIEKMGLGQGHVKFGCSTGVMRTWVRRVNP